MKPQPISKLGVGPMSSEIIEAVFCFSERESVPLMLIASKNQIDHSGGYVNQWSTKEYMKYVNELRAKYPNAKVYICRDHCGPGFNGIHDLKDVYKTLDADIENGFDFIHVDFCHFKGKRDEMLKEAKKALQYIQKKAPAIMLEIGTDENRGDHLTDIERISNEIKFFKSVAPIHFFVCQTGSLTKEINQIGSFNASFIKKIREVADQEEIFLKEHNGDYLSAEEIQQRGGLIDAMNVAPQQGVLQTLLTLEKCKIYGINPDEFLQTAYSSRKWEKWLHINSSDNKLLCSIIAGHYMFNTDEYKRILDKISKHENIRQSIIEAMMQNFRLYVENLR